MKIQDRIKLLANRINQPHYIEYHFKKVMQEAYLKGVKDTEEKQLSLCSVVGQSEQLKAYSEYLKGRICDSDEINFSELLDDFKSL